MSATEDTTIVHFAWHQLIEAYIERSGLAYTHLRPASFMQNLRFSAESPGVLTHFIGAARPRTAGQADRTPMALRAARTAVLLADRLADVLHKLEEPGKAAEDVAKAIEEVEEAVKKLEKVEEPANDDEISSPVRHGWFRGPGGW